MARAKTKTELIKAGNEQFAKMWELIDSLTEDEQNTLFNFGTDDKRKEAHWKRDKNMRDILVHLYEWHQLLINWIVSNQKGEPKPFLLEPYTWKTYGDMNVEFWKKHQATSYKDSKKMICDSHKKVMNMIEQFSNDELFEKKQFAWTGTTTLGSYCISATASHYDWAMKKIKLHIKTVR